MMYRPTGMGVDPFYENFKFFLTYWLLSSNNRDRIGDVDQLPPPPPNGPQGPPYMSPHHKPTHGTQGHQNQTPKSPNSAAPGSGSNGHQITWGEPMGDKPGQPTPNGPPTQQTPNSPRHTQNLSLVPNSFDISLKQQLQQQQPLLNGPPSAGGHHGNHGNPHLSAGHQPNSMMQPDHMMLGEKDRRHVCPHCYKGFRSRQQLNQHNLVHSGLRKYHCLYCERSFKQLSHLQQHHRIHTGEKPYRCPLEGCDKAFAQMSNLQHHMRQHDKTTFGQKHCMCPFCDRGYASEKSLKSHLSKMHPDSKMLNLGSPRSALSSLMEGQGHRMLGSPQPGVTISHRHSLPTMHHSMKSPLTPPGGPLELTVNSISHQRNSLGNDGRKYSLDSNKMPLNADMMPHDGKFFQRSLSDRLPDRDQNKIDSMFDQRYGIQNHIRDVNRFPGRPFEPFSPSRYLDNSRGAFDMKELDSKLFDPTVEKFQRMAENFNEFRTRFSDQMFRRDGLRGGSMPYDNRNMLQEINDRNNFFNMRNDMNLNRDRYPNNRSFNGMNGNELDGFGSNRPDELRVNSRSNVNVNSPNASDFSRPNEGPNDEMAMQLEDGAGTGGNMHVDQNMNMRMSAETDDMMMNRASTIHMNQENDPRMNRRNGLMGNADNDLSALGQRQMMGGGVGGRGMMMSQADGNDIMRARGNLLNQRSEMMSRASENGVSQAPDIDITDRNDYNVDKDREHRNYSQKNDMGKSRPREMMDGNDIRVGHGNEMTVNGQADVHLQNGDLTVDSMNMNEVNRNGNDLRVQSRGNAQINMCNTLQMNGQDSSYHDKPDMRLQNQNGIMLNQNDRSHSVHEEMNIDHPNNLHSISNPHPGPKQNGHDPLIENGGMDFGDDTESKRSPISNQMSDPNLIRQRKRKPANPQHVFMPSIDHYTSFAADDVEDCSGLMLDVENGGSFERKISRVALRN